VGVCHFAGFSGILFFQEFINQVSVAEVGRLITGELALRYEHTKWNLKWLGSIAFYKINMFACF
jgi:hypothetical protein